MCLSYTKHSSVDAQYWLFWGFGFVFVGFFFLFFSRELAVTSVKQHRVPEAGVGEGKKEVGLSVGGDE